jgi:cobyrinic acid a,c-diamide synthase
MIPRLVIAGTSSGVGKTTVMVALTEALRRRGRRVAVFKCGPDYLDPTYHARAAGAACHNLDGWMMGRDAVLATFARASAGADVALIEGVMGLYDGASPDSDEGSAAEIAKWLDAPVLAVVDGSGMARTLAAVALGLRDFDTSLRLAGVFVNRVGSPNHVDLLRSACAKRNAPPVIGALPDEPGLAFPERHLGLRTADEVPAEKLHAWGALVEKWIDLDALERLAASAPASVSAPAPARATSASAPRCRIALASDAAFHFYYDDNLRRLESLGAELVRFSPLADARLPTAVDGVYLGGGYPELHAAALAENRAMRDSLRAFAASGAPVYAECGGLMYLARALRTLDGREHEMVGLVPGVAVMRDRLQALGYVEVETQRRTLLGGAGLRFRGHQFRYSTLEGAGDGSAYSVRKRRGGQTHAEGYGADNLLASYVHAHWASNPLCAEGFVRACAERRQ